MLVSMGFINLTTVALVVFIEEVPYWILVFPLVAVLCFLLIQILRKKGL